MSSPATAPAPPAAASNTDRRSFLATLAAAGVMTGATGALAALDATEHPDVELLELVRLLAAADVRLNDLGERSDAAYADHYREPPLTEAVLWQRSDRYSVWMQPERLDCALVGGEQRYLYVTEGALTDLYSMVGRWKALTLIDRICGPNDIARAEEIIAAVEAWNAKQKTAWTAAGLTEIDHAYDEQATAMSVLVQRMLDLPAQTPEGICAKARAAGILRAHDDRQAALTASLIGDAMQLGDADAQQASSGASVAA